MNPETSVEQPTRPPLLSPLTPQQQDTLQEDPNDGSSPRVFLGPVLSPERQFRARNANSRSMRTPPPILSPVRRSARLSLAPPPLFAIQQSLSEDEVDAAMVAEEDEDGLQDGACFSSIISVR